VKLTLKSSEPIENAMRVVGALYGVTLMVAPEKPESEQPLEATESAPSGDARKSSRGPRATTRKGSRSGPAAPRPGAEAESPGSARSLGLASNAEVRSWARANGLTVNERGRIPASVQAAYRDAHPL
jgi:hypothetical protein